MLTLKRLVDIYGNCPICRCQSETSPPMFAECPYGVQEHAYTGTCCNRRASWSSYMYCVTTSDGARIRGGIRGQANNYRS